MIEFRLLILMPIAAGLFLFLLPEIIKVFKGLIALAISAFTVYLSYLLFSGPSGTGNIDCVLLPMLKSSLTVNVDGLSKLIVIFISSFGLLYIIYSLAYIKREKKIISYYSYFLITLGASFGAVLVDNLILFVFFWGILGLTLYKLIKSYNAESSDAAKKTLVLIGASDSILIFGIGILFKITGSLSFSEIEGLSIQTSGALYNIAFLSLLVASMTKAGALPFHTWVPDYVKNAPASSSAFLPASLDKLLGKPH